MIYEINKIDGIVRMDRIDQTCRRGEVKLNRARLFGGKDLRGTSGQNPCGLH